MWKTVKKKRKNDGLGERVGVDEMKRKEREREKKKEGGRKEKGEQRW